MSWFREDLRLAFRTLRRAPAFSVIAIVTLSLGIAATTAIFSLFYQVLLRSLAVPQPERLVVLHATGPLLPGGSSSGNHETSFSYPMYERLAAHPLLPEGIAARAGTTLQITLPEGAQRIDAELISGSYFAVLGLRPALGRLISPEDDQPGRPNPVVVLTHGYWIKTYGANPDVLNRKILLNGNPFLIVGVAPEGYGGFVTGDARAIFLPLSSKLSFSPGWQGFNEPGTQWLNIFARLKPGVSRQQATASLRPVWASALRDHIQQLKIPDGANRKVYLAKSLQVIPAAGGVSNLEARWRKPLTVLLAMVSLLLVIACVNVANLLMARSLARGRETAIRVAVGAGRASLFRQSFAESLLVAFAAGVAGILLCFAFLHAIIAILPGGGTRSILSATPDLTVLSFSLLIVLATALVFGTFPALHASRIDPIQSLKEQITTGTGAASHWRHALVAGQLALSLTLLAGAGFFTETLIKLLQHDPGLLPDHLIVFALNPERSGYSVEGGRGFYRELKRRLEQLPGVHSVALAEYSPLAGSEWSSNVTVEGFSARNMQEAISDKNAVGPGFFRTLGTPLMRGREFDEHDTGSKVTVAIVNEAFAKHFLGGADPIGKRMTIGDGPTLNMTIVGEVKNSQNLDLREIPKPTFFFPFDQTYDDPKELPQANFFVRSSSDPKTLEPAIRRTVRGIDAGLPFNIHTMNELVSAVTYLDRLSAMLAITFGILATVLAAIGLYGVIAYAVTRRMLEMGIRLALGALPGQVLALIMREVAALAIGGVLIGIPLAYALAKAMSSQLYGVQPRDIAIYFAATAVLVLACFFAGLVPALRAARVDPKTALHYE